MKMKINGTGIVNEMKKILAGTAAMLLMTIAVVLCSSYISVMAADVSVTSINYDNSTITVQLSKEDTALFISDAKQKKWQYVPIAKDGSDQVTFDISWIAVNKDYVLSLKGDVSSTPVKVTLPKQVNNFKATYSTGDGTVSFTNASGRNIEWKKKNGMFWIPVSENSDLAAELSGMISNGATVLVRLAARNGTGLSDPGARPSKEVSLVVPKKAAAPVITVNDSYLTITLSKGLEYRYTDKDGIPSDVTWVEVTKDENRRLSEFATAAMDGSDDVYAQFRTKRSSSKQVSNSTTIKIPLRSAVSQDEADSCSVEYRSSTTFAIKATAATTTNPFEYCIISKSDIDAGISDPEEKYEEVKWKEINSSSEVIIDKNKDKVENGSKVFIRRKAYKKLGEDDYRLASNIICQTLINYPGDVSVASGAALKTIAGVCNSSNPKGYLTFVLFSPSESNITAIKLHDGKNQVSLSQSDFKSTVVTNSDNSASADQKYIITTTIMSTAAADNYAQSYDNNGTEVNSGDFKVLYSIGQSSMVTRAESAINLKIYGASKLNNPSGTSEKEEVAQELSSAGNAGWNLYSASSDKNGYSQKIDRIFKSNRIYGTEGYQDFEDADQNEFKFKIDFGTAVNPLSSTDEEVLITGIKYDNVLIPHSDNTYYKVDYCTRKDASGRRDVRYAVVTLYVDKIENISGITVRDKYENLNVILSNGESIDSVSMNLKRSATLSKNLTGRTIAIDEVPEKRTTTVTNGDSTETISEPNRDYVITYNVLDNYTGLTVIDITWEGESILLDTDSNSIYLSVGKMKEVMETRWPTTKTRSANVVITFNNGFSIDKGYMLTLTHKGTN